MQRSLLVKALLVAAILLALQVPLTMIDGIVAERSARQQAVVRELASASYGKAVLAGPILSVPFVEEYVETVNEGGTSRPEQRRAIGAARFFASRDAIEGAASVETKSRGLFKARVFSWRGTAVGEFVLDGKPQFHRVRPDSRIIWGKPILSVLLSDPRGLRGTPVLEFGGQTLALERGSGLPQAPSGIHAGLPEFDPTKPQRFDYRLVMALRGSESLSIVPLAADQRMRLHADWPHPSFGGQFLPSPASFRPDRGGFDAQWEVTALSSYGFLFVAFTFGCLILYEIMKPLPIHPAQYLLVGLSLATFFLLLIALSEHIAFWVAYLLAAAACIASLTFYLSAVLRGAGATMAFAAILAALYGTLYAMLVSEDNALLTGSLLVFASLAATMTITRNVNWYRLGPSGKPAGLG